MNAIKTDGKAGIHGTSVRKMSTEKTAYGTRSTILTAEIYD